MDVEGFSLVTVDKNHVEGSNNESIQSREQSKRDQLVNANNNTENVDISKSSVKYDRKSKNKQAPIIEPSIHSKQASQSAPLQTDHSKEHEIVHSPDRDNNHEGDENIANHLTNDGDNTMFSSYTTGDENDVVEIHQLSPNDIDAYLDIYFETLDNRLRHFIGDDYEIQQFRVAMKNRLDSNTNAPEYRNVLLGKINGEVLAAVTMLFSKESPIISQPLPTSERNACLTSIRRWMIQKANYIPTNIEECYIEMIGVKNDYRNRGIGSAMIECVEYFAQQAGANLLTIHISGQRSRSFFERYDFTNDRSDNSPFWKWIVERQRIVKLSKMLPSIGENAEQTTSSYVNESIVGSIDG